MVIAKATYVYLSRVREQKTPQPKIQRVILAIGPGRSFPQSLGGNDSIDSSSKR